MLVSPKMTMIGWIAINSPAQRPAHSPDSPWRPQWSTTVGTFSGCGRSTRPGLRVFRAHPCHFRCCGFRQSPSSGERVRSHPSELPAYRGINHHPMMRFNSGTRWIIVSTHAHTPSRHQLTIEVHFPPTQSESIAHICMSFLFKFHGTPDFEC